VLVTTSCELADAIDQQIARQLEDLPTRDTATAAIDNGFSVIVETIHDAIKVCDRIAPEHLQVLTTDPDLVAARLSHWGGLFIGPTSAEVFGDYGVGPNHTLPTGGVARFKGGLSVLDFLRVRTWLKLEDGDGADEMARDAAALARLEGLEAHARAAERRIRKR
jgi:phosphoribosyl-ATP pyrophosphohydrolase/phosphoribosyl-AMP cyclohydrolase/histidinol dehydrogenase